MSKWLNYAPSQNDDYGARKKLAGEALHCKIDGSIFRNCDSRNRVGSKTTKFLEVAVPLVVLLEKVMMVRLMAVKQQLFSQILQRMGSKKMVMLHLSSFS